ncbi:MAG: glycine/sarcosine/betaine reductase complex component C subunit beta [Acidimicrobiales bacterium]
METRSNQKVVVSAATQVLAHVPGIARHGSKPSRELGKDKAVEEKFLSSLRSYEDAVAYPPHQAYIGALHPRDLPERPWTDVHGEASRSGPAGEIIPEEELFGLLAAADEFDLLTLAPDLAEQAASALSGHPLAKVLAVDTIARTSGDPEKVAKEPGALGLHTRDGRLVAAIRCGQLDDASLAADILLENLAGKATASLALLHLLDRHGVDPASIDYVIGCGEEAVGDRYQRGGGNMGKSVAGFTGLTEASGADIKNFCAAPLPALVIAGSLVSSGVFDRVAVVAGGSLAKLGMKFQGHLKHDLPVLEDVLGGAAAVIQRDDGKSPVMRLDAVGRHRVAAGGAATQIMEALALEPLGRVDLRTTDIDDFATELHNPEITEPQGSGDVPARNYKTIAALAARKGDIEKGDIAEFVRTRGMPGFSPTQGHLASALCYLPHAVERLTSGDVGRVMMLAKGSLFLGRLCQLSDGMSLLLERNKER